jgi:ribonuclease HII
MTWIVGIDEAGYGPNLGPFVMTAVACRVPERLAGADFWKLLRRAVRRVSEPDDGRLLVEDSKLVYSTTRGLHDLEKSVLAFLSPSPGEALLLCRLLDRVCPDSHRDLRIESWYTGTTSLPVQAETPFLLEAARRLTQSNGNHQLHWGLIRSVVWCPPRFNQLLDRWGTKSAVLGQALAAMLQNALPDGMIIAHEEGNARSVYSVLGLERTVRLTFQPRAEADYFPVALASMISKYLRELLMLEFNHFWQTQVPGLKPTAGYPGDAARFFQAIRPAVKRLRIDADAVWRRK